MTYDTLGEARDITEVINLIAKLGGANIVVAPEVAGSLSLRLTDVPWRDALDVAVKTLGYVVVEENRGILRVVDPVTLQAQMTTKSYQLRYLRPRGRFRPSIKSEFLVPSTIQNQVPKDSEVAAQFTVIQALSKALTPGGELDYIASQNVIIVRDTAQVHQQIADMLNRLDVEPAQVFLDCKFVSTTNSDLLDLGVDYGDTGPSASISLGAVPITVPFGLGGGDWEDGIIAIGDHEGPFTDPLLNGSGGTAAPATVFGALDFTQVQATLKLLQQDTKTDVIQAPKIIALDGAEATILLTESFKHYEVAKFMTLAGTGFVLAAPLSIGLKRWNRQIERAGHSFRLTLPSPHFRRSIGAWVGKPVDPQGRLVSQEEFSLKLKDWIPSESDRAFIHSLMRKVAEPGKIAGWVAPPDRGINNLPVEYEYVKLH